MLWGGLCLSIEIPNIQNNAGDGKVLKRVLVIIVAVILIFVLIIVMFRFKIVLVLVGAVFFLLAFAWLKKRGVIV